MKFPLLQQYWYENLTILRARNQPALQLLSAKLILGQIRSVFNCNQNRRKRANSLIPNEDEDEEKMWILLPSMQFDMLFSFNHPWMKFEAAIHVLLHLEATSVSAVAFGVEIWECLLRFVLIEKLPTSPFPSRHYTDHSARPSLGGCREFYGGVVIFHGRGSSCKTK